MPNLNYAKIREMRAVIDEPEKWIQDRVATTSTGISVTTESPRAECFCMLGAMHRVGLSQYGSEGEAILSEARRYSRKEWGAIHAFNDAPGRKHEHVMLVIDRVLATEPAHA